MDLRVEQDQFDDLKAGEPDINHRMVKCTSWAGKILQMRDTKFIGSITLL